MKKKNNSNFTTKYLQFSCFQRGFWPSLGYHQYLARKGKGKEGDIMPSKMGSISLLASPGSYSFSHSRGPELGPTKGIDTPSVPTMVPCRWAMQGEVLDHRGLSV